jgi:hypothetical protein
MRAKCFPSSLPLWCAFFICACATFLALAEERHFPSPECADLLKALWKSRGSAYKVGTASRLPERIREKVLGDLLPKAVNWLGQGGQGTVYRVEPPSGEAFLVKVFHFGTTSKEIQEDADAFESLKGLPQDCFQFGEVLELNTKETFIKYADVRWHPLDEILKSGLTPENRATIAKLYHSRAQNLATELTKKGWSIQAPPDTTNFGTYFFTSPHSLTPQIDTFRIVPRNTVVDLETGTVTLIDPK